LCAEVDHALLIERLEKFDAWALSCSSPSLQQILALCPSTVRVAAWVKPFGIFKPNVNPAYVWEPVIFRTGSRKRTRKEKTVRDWVSCNITLKKGLCGVKPAGFSQWLFDLLGMLPGDEFHDLFPGSGAVTEEWKKRIAATPDIRGCDICEGRGFQVYGGEHYPCDGPIHQQANPAA
jgi:hypothetical protein